ncbi:MAG: MFS transporter [Nocardioides sp.]
MPAPREPLLTRSFVLLTASDLAYFLGAGVLVFATPLFVAGPLAGGPAQVGWAMGSFSVTTLVLRPWLGRWTDRHGRRLLLVGGAAGFALVVLAHLAVDSLAGLVAVRLVLGAAEACYFVAGFAALADLAPPDRAGEALSLNSLALYVGIAVGPVAGQGLVAAWGYPAAWVGAACCVGVAAVLVSAVPETRGSSGPAVDGPPPLLHPAIRGPGIALALGLLAMSAFLPFSVLLARVSGIPWVSAGLLVFGSTVVVCRLVFARLPDRVPAAPLAGAALVASGAGMLLLGTWPTATGLVVGALVCGAGSAFLTPAVFGLVFRSVPAAERGAAAGGLSMFMDLGLTGGPLLLGLVAAAGGLGPAFALMAVPPLVGALVLSPRIGRTGRSRVRPAG